MMAGLDDYPIVFLDVDGTLIPFRARRAESALVAARALVPADDASGNPLLDRLDPADGSRLRALGCRLVWATTWMADANDLVAPRLGLPELPVVEFADNDEPERGLHWKTAFLTRCAAGRRFVWLDDEITDADRRWVQAHHPRKALLHRVDPFIGLTDADFALIRQWLATR
jgi:HAD domain in Swiss Army Knife RNA repair proteins